MSFDPSTSLQVVSARSGALPMTDWADEEARRLKREVEEKEDQHERNTADIETLMAERNSNHQEIARLRGSEF